MNHIYHYPGYFHARYVRISFIYLQTGTPLSTLQVLLEFHPDNTVELDVSSWLKEVYFYHFYYYLGEYVDFTFGGFTSYVFLVYFFPALLSIEHSKEEFNELQTLRKLGNSHTTLTI